MSVIRPVSLAIFLGLLAAACGSTSGGISGGVGGSTTTSKTTAATTGSTTSSTTGSGGGTSTSSGTTTSSTTSTSTGTTTTTTTTTATMCAGPGGCMAPVCPPMLEHLEPVTNGPGLVLTWTEPQACDSVEVESEYGLIPYPSQQNPPKAPQFTVTPGTLLSLTDPTATGTNMYTYHSRCVVGGVKSCWSNELANNGHTVDGGP